MAGWWRSNAMPSINAVECILVGVCNKRAQGGGLGRQIEEVVKRAGEHTPVIVRSTDFPNNPKAAVSRQLGQLITGGGRRVVVQDSDWRAMMALSSFRKQSGADPSFAAWLKRTRPLTSLNSLRAILDLDHVGRRSGPAVSGRQTATVSSPPAPPLESIESLIVGTTSDRRGEPVTIEPGELTRHAAFLGAPGSGKTTAALCVVEQLLLRGVPAILVDRKGDLCSYARPDMGLREGLEGELADRAVAAAHDGRGRPVHAAPARWAAAVDRGRPRRLGRLAGPRARAGRQVFRRRSRRDDELFRPESRPVLPGDPEPGDRPSQPGDAASRRCRSRPWSRSSPRGIPGC